MRNKTPIVVSEERESAIPSRTRKADSGVVTLRISERRDDPGLDRKTQGLACYVYRYEVS